MNTSTKYDFSILNSCVCLCDLTETNRNLTLWRRRLRVWIHRSQTYKRMSGVDGYARPNSWHLQRNWPVRTLNCSLRATLYKLSWTTWAPVPESCWADWRRPREALHTWCAHTKSYSHQTHACDISGKASNILYVLLRSYIGLIIVRFLTCTCHRPLADEHMLY